MYTATYISDDCKLVFNSLSHTYILMI